MHLQKAGSSCASGGTQDVGRRVNEDKTSLPAALQLTFVRRLEGEKKTPTHEELQGHQATALSQASLLHQAANLLHPLCRRSESPHVCMCSACSPAVGLQSVTCAERTENKPALTTPLSTFVTDMSWVTLGKQPPAGGQHPPDEPGRPPPAFAPSPFSY